MTGAVITREFATATSGPPSDESSPARTPSEFNLTWREKRNLLRPERIRREYGADIPQRSVAEECIKSGPRGERANANGAGRKNGGVRE
jgi:hypothetical protein